MSLEFAVKQHGPSPMGQLASLMLVAGVLAAAAGGAQAAPMACLIEPSQVVDIGSPVVGVIASVEVERGER